MRPDPADLTVRHHTPGEDSLLPRLDIVIVNWNAGRHLKACLDSIAAAATDGLILDRVVVVDNASSDDSLEAIARPVPPLSVIRNERNRGFAAACNQGAAGSSADYLLFLNPDVILDRGSLSGAVAFMEAKENQEIDISGIRLRDPQGRTQRCCARFPTPGRMAGQAVALDRLLPGIAAPHFLIDWDHEDSRDVPQVMGAFLLIRRAAFQRLGGFDERFFLYYEDVDLCYRLVRQGGRCAHNAAASAVHAGGGTTEAIRARRQFLSAQSRILYARKHFGAPAALLVGLAALIGEPAARLLRGAARRSRREMTDSLEGAWLLWRALPGLLRGAAPPAERPRPSILALTRYPRQGASSRTRFLAYLPALREAGFAVEVSPFFDETYLDHLYNRRPQRRLAILASYWRRLAALRRARSFDLVWIEKEALPWLPLALEKRLLGPVPFVLDYDDAWYLRYADHPLRPLLAGKLDGLIREARATLVGNDFLAAWAKRAGARRVIEMPTLVAFDRYRPCPPRAGSGPLRIGWIGTPSSAELYLKPLMPVLAQAVRQGWATLTVVGADSPELAAAGPVTFLPWTEEAEIECLHDFDVGIMPLLDDAWSQGKCAYKLIQYMAVGLPVVASPIGMNRKVVSHGETGFLAATPEEWLEALRRLAADPELRRRLGEAGRRRVERDFSLAPAAPKLIDGLREAAGSCATPSPRPSPTRGEGEEGGPASLRRRGQA